MCVKRDRRDNILNALTFVVRFTTAQFKDHMHKLVRRTYLLPPPSAVAGFIGAILGLSREELYKISNRLFAGSMLRSLEGIIVSLARIYKLGEDIYRILKMYYSDDPSERKEGYEDIQNVMPIEESEELYRPEYKYAIASEDEKLIETLLEKLKNFDFEYDVFGGNDYHFVEYIGEVKPAVIEKSKEGYGYCPREYFEKVDAETYKIMYNTGSLEKTEIPVMIPVKFLARVNTEFIQVFKAKIYVKKDLYVVNDGYDKVFVYNVEQFMI